MSLSTAELDAALDAIAATEGPVVAGRLRLVGDPGRRPDSFDWSRTDRIVEARAARNLSIIALAAYTPDWARPPGTPDKNPPTNPDDYARFVSAAAQRYASLGVTTWEIWNEPNVSTFWYPRPDPEGYTALLVRASAAIQAVDPNATIISGGLAPASDNASGSQIDVRTFLTRVYAAGGGARSTRSACIPTRSRTCRCSRPTTTRSSPRPALYQVMVDHGDAAKRIWGTEVGAPTAGGGGSVTEAVQSQILARRTNSGPRGRSPAR